MKKSKMNKNTKNVYTCKDVYKAYAEDLLKRNPDYWGKFGMRIRNAIIYKQVGKNVVEVISYPKFKEIIDTYFTRAKHYIIEGYEFNLGNDLGKVAGRRVERNLSNLQINYGATGKMPKDENGKPTKIIYYTDPDWCRIGWKKTLHVKNITQYAFVPTPHDMRGHGFKYEFSKALEANKLLKYRYEFYAYIRDKEEE